MQVESSPKTVRNLVRAARQNGLTVGVVPTMGALHSGHLSLVTEARKQCDFVVATIFVNPTQFGPNEDFERYPRTLEQDLQLCEEAGADLVFTPDTTDMYRADAQSIVHVNQLTRKLEGAVRPDHFDGVTTIVAKLFNVTIPDKAFFGQKDFQQQLIIKQMVKDLDWDIQIVTCPIIREDDGLAMSSRNRYLSPQDRQRCLVLNRALVMAEKLASESASPETIVREMTHLIESQDGVILDYAVVADSETLEPAEQGTESAVALVAARLGKTRLIDNRILRFR